MSTDALAADRPKRIRLSRDRRVIAGVCSGIAERLGIDPVIVRLAFLGATMLSGAGLLAYALAALVLPSAEGDPLSARFSGGRGNLEIAAGTGLLALSAALLLRSTGWWFSDAIVWPAVAAAVGGALIWRQFAAGPEDVTAAAAPMDHEAGTAKPPFLRGGALSKIGVGIALVLGAALMFLWANGALSAAGDAVLAATVVVVALGLIFAPLWWRLGRNLATERGERIRSQERAELGAHLHDSVLQTLALVQQRAGNPREVAALARRQERELRGWLQDRPSARTGDSLAATLGAAAAEIEDAHGCAVEVVTVGDCKLDGGAEAVLGAAREAILNAAKFAGAAGPIDVFAEVTPARIEIFVRDRGPGFDLGAVPADRHGVRESVIGRMERHGGGASVRAGAGGGTEVELSIARAAE
ncbi:MAG: PspC domain-containing protein [Actinomycetota bacterium]|nr:PspC domain-containing protein [Actinomycetota bacterium]